jgi:hypothetical protein
MARDAIRERLIAIDEKPMSSGGKIAKGALPQRAATAVDSRGDCVIKIVFSWRDHPDKTAEECDEHYRRVHMKLAAAAFDGAPGFGGLVYNRVKDGWVNDFNQSSRVEAESIADAWVELYFEDRATLELAFQRPLVQELFDDHPNFMAVEVPSNIRVYDVEEVLFVGTRLSS